MVMLFGSLVRRVERRRAVYNGDTEGSTTSPGPSEYLRTSPGPSAYPAACVGLLAAGGAAGSAEALADGAKRGAAAAPSPEGQAEQPG
jgi:hypothetical protein